MSKPTTITAAQFVEGGYAEKIARGECVVIDASPYHVKTDHPLTVREIVPQNTAGRHLHACDVIYWNGRDGMNYRWANVDERTKLIVEWLPDPRNQQAAEAGRKSEATRLSYALESVAGDWVRVHIALSDALGMEFEPNEDVERYTEAIAALQAENTRLQNAYDQKVKEFDDFEFYNEDKLTEVTRERDALREALKKCAEVAREGQGEWASVDPVYQPESIHPLSDIEDIASKALFGTNTSEPDHK